jgi:hypothetical protein
VKDLHRAWPPDVKPDRQGEQQDVWFRGQHYAGWGLSPKLYRDEFKGAQEAEIRQEFQSRALQLIQGRVPSREDSWEWYFLMQHYGAPTRLLDWTDNALVALYFAVNDKLMPGDSSVWVLDPWWLNKNVLKGIDGPLLPDWEEASRYLKDLETCFTLENEVSVKMPAALDPPHVDRRIAAQRSRFLIFGKSTDLTRTKLVRKKKCRLAKITIPEKSVSAIRLEVENCGLTISTLFPDLQNLCREMCDRWKKFPRPSKKIK